MLDSGERNTGQYEDLDVSSALVAHQLLVGKMIIDSSLSDSQTIGQSSEVEVVVVSGKTDNDDEGVKNVEFRYTSRLIPQLEITNVVSVGEVPDEIQVSDLLTNITSEGVLETLQLIRVFTSEGECLSEEGVLVSNNPGTGIIETIRFFQDKPPTRILKIQDPETGDINVLSIDGDVNDLGNRVNELPITNFQRGKLSIAMGYAKMFRLESEFPRYGQLMIDLLAGLDRNVD